jgi:hypothetical protein
MTWEIVAGIIALTGFCVTVGTLASRLTAILTRLEASVAQLSEAVGMMREGNEAEHRRLRVAVGDHEKRIVRLETRPRGKTEESLAGH